ncbi:hypothetical protein [Actinomadura sp. 3N407]|uniref:hypothetical protein n=1 Tax=Actinomadura sp. 3N407 TaxID=3457423 RepID=UPI003FCEA643
MDPVDDREGGMSHRTAYVLRLVDGSCWTMGKKWGDWYLAREGDRDRIVESILRDGMVVSDDRARDFVDTGFCRGLVLDFVTRRYRYFNRDDALQHGVGYVESAALRLASAPEWEGWEVGYAWGGREGLVEAVPEAGPVVAREAVEEGNPWTPYCPPGTAGSWTGIHSNGR